MKRFLSLLLAVSFIVLLAACDKAENFHDDGEPVAEAPTAEPSAAPTEMPTASPEPTEEPSPAPTEAPDYSAYLPRMGNLVGGPIFPEPFKYLVLPGESNMHYVFNNMGELLYTFSASVYDDTEYDLGLYKEEGVCCWLRLSDRTETEPFCVMDGMAVTLRYVEPTPSSWEDSYYEIANIRGDDLEIIKEFKRGELNLGHYGGIARLGEGYLVFRCDYLRGCTALTLLDSGFKKTGTLDPRKFETFGGVFGSKYIIGMNEYFENEEGEYIRTFNIYDLEGGIVAENVELVGEEFVTLETSEFWDEVPRRADYFMTADGKYYDRDLNEVEGNPKQAAFEARYTSGPYYKGTWIYGDYEVVTYGVYSGIADPEGNWIFRIYNPRYATDNDNERNWFGEYWW